MLENNFCSCKEQMWAKLPLCNLLSQKDLTSILIALVNEVSKTKPNDFYQCLKSLCEFCLKVNIKSMTFSFVRIKDVTKSLCGMYRMFVEVFASWKMPISFLKRRTGMKRIQWSCWF